MAGSMKLDRQAGSGQDPLNKATQGVDKTLTKGLLLLEAISRSERSRGVSDLASELSLTRSNVHRLLQTLIASGFVSREVGGDRYVLTSKLWRLSRMQRHHNALLSLVHPVLSEFVAETGESAAFAIVEGKNIVMIDQVETPHSVRVFYSVGDTHPVDHVLLSGRGISALQLVVYAFRPKAEVLRALETISQELGHPPSYVTDQMARIDVVRREGHALVQGEWVEGANAVAAAVTGKDGELVGIMVSFGPAHRMPPSVLEALRLSTCQAAARLSAQLVN